MAGDVRKRMVEGAVQLLARKGLHGTSVADVIDLTSAPRGSIYYHFPKGKDELVAAAVDLTAEQAVALLDRKAGAPAIEVTAYFLEIWRIILSRSQFEAGCALLAVTIAAESVDMLNHAAAAFRKWRGRLAELLAQGGLADEDAERMAALLLSAGEGAVVMSRAERNMHAFELVATSLVDQVARCAAPDAEQA